jgi:hypothetical protein
LPLLSTSRYSPAFYNRNTNKETTATKSKIYLFFPYIRILNTWGFYIKLLVRVEEGEIPSSITNQAFRYLPFKANSLPLAKIEKKCA